MNDAERNHLLHRIADLERANRRWKLLALAGTPLLALVLVLAVGNGIACYVMFRDARQREEQARVEAENARLQAEEALYRARIAQVQAVRAAAGARVGATDVEQRKPEPKP
jgi:hypothetical protein